MKTFAAFVLCVCSCASCASQQINNPDTKRLTDIIDERASKRTPEGLAAANNLNRMGDKAYKRHRYLDAFNAYDNSYPNYPNAYAYVMSGDSLWRDILRVHTTKIGLERRHKGCDLNNTDFVHDLSMDIDQHQAVGIALASRTNNLPAPNPTFYRRARESTACLQAMAQHYQAEPPSACVDLNQLRKCLGAPLIK